MSDQTPPLKRTALFDRHRQAGGKLVEFAGWEMPVQYSSVIDEHRAVRTAAGLFDVSHMGEVAVRGPGAEAFLEWLTPNRVAALTPGRIHYTGLLTSQGTYIDDLLIYRIGEQEFMLVVNAANRDKDLEWMLSKPHDGVEIEDRSDEVALLALQGPVAPTILQPLTPADLDELRYYRFVESEVAGCPALVSRTGYTGELGYELYVAPQHAGEIWDRLIEAGEPHGLRPVGLGARDTLRLEAAMALYGQEIDEGTTPFDAGLDWVVKMDKGEFFGRHSLVRQQAEGVSRKLVGFEVTGRGIARHGHEVIHDGEPVGEVTSGTWSPSMEKALGMAYVPAELAISGNEIGVEVRGRVLEARLVDLPFYKRSKV